MTDPLRLNTDELMSALDAINPVDVLVEEFVGTAAGEERAPYEEGRLTPWHGAAATDDTPATELMLLADLRVGGSCVLPVSALHAARTAALAALAAKKLVAPGVVTAAVLGSSVAAQLSLALIARNLHGLSHVAVYGPERPVEPKVVDQLDLAGVGWSLTDTVAQAVFGATLIVTTAGARGPEAAQLPKGTLLVNASGADLADELIDAVDQIYVDDATLLESSPHRLARMRPARPGPGSVSLSRADSRRYRRIEADLAQLLTGAHAGRTHVDQVILIELLGTRMLDVRLACALYRAALELGLGIRLVE